MKEYQNKNNKLYFYENKYPVSVYRTHRIAYARNFCLQIIKKNLHDYEFFAMMDFDDPNSKSCNLNVLKDYLERNDWDGLSFNTSPKYYDIWGLSIYPFCFSYNHFNNNYKYHNIIGNYINNKLNNLNETELLPCISSFNGFSIYRINKFINCKYDGRPRLDLMPQSWLFAHIQAQKSKIIYKNYGHINGYYEDCEHRSFHIEAIFKNRAKIMISPKFLFT